MVYILDVEKNELVEAEIVLAASGEMPLKKDGWSFNWRNLFKEENSRTFVLKTIEKPLNIEGVLQLKTENDMLIMDVIEIAPNNIGSKNKKYDYVAGCLIAFGCRESFQIDGIYKGFLTFVSKTNLIEWYVDKYQATIALGQKMYIDSEIGLKLIEEYLEREQ